MNITRSIRHCLVDVEQDQSWLAAKLGISRQQMNNLMNDRSRFTEGRIEHMAEIFDMTSVDFVKLGAGE